MAFAEGNKLFARDFRTNLDETNADMVQFTKRWNWKWITSSLMKKLIFFMMIMKKLDLFIRKI